MKLVIGMVISTFLIVNYQQSSVDSVFINELNDLIEVGDQSGVEIDSWTIYQRSTAVEVMHSVLQKKIDEIKRENQQMKWKVVKNGDGNHHLLIIGEKRTSRFLERKKITAYTQSNHRYLIFVSTEIIGDRWDDESIQHIQNSGLSSEFDTYYSIKGKISKAENLSEEAANLLDSYSAEVIEGIIEPSFVSLSAYTSIFQSSIAAKNGEKMNIQIGLRASTHSEIVDVMLATPIIIKEY
ncbi:YwmB family TATA-box binding protein [Bacillus timonensis]|nr:YwmB family TATA-box binding protein [Bacillus timonensis]